MPRVEWLPTALNYDCGPACLAMVLKHHGCESTVDTVRERLGTSRDGTTGLDLVRVAREFGMDARGFRLADRSALANVPLPIIAHYESGHFVIVEQVRNDRVRVVDPMEGRRVLPMEEFNRLASGVIVTLERGPDFRPRSDRSIRRFVRSTLTERWKLLLGLVAVSLVFQGIAFAVPALVGYVVDTVIPHHSLSFLALIATAVPAFMAAYALSSWLRGRAMSTLVARVSHTWLDRLYRHMLRLPLPYFSGRPVQDLVIRAQGVDIVVDEMLDRVISGGLDTLLAVTALIALFTMYPQISGLVVAAIAVQTVVAWLAQRQTVDTFIQDLIAHTRLYAFTADTLGGIADVKMIGIDRLGPTWTRLLESRVEAGARRRRTSATWDGLLSAAQGAAPLLVLVAGANMAIAGSATVGVVVAFYTLAGVCLSPVARLATSIYHFRSMTEYLRRAYEVLETTPEPDGTGDGIEPVDRVVGDIGLEGVSYRFKSNGDDVLADIDLDIRAGDTVAVVGRTGSGKSTLAKILATLYAPTTGAMRIDGVPVERLVRSQLRRHIGVVFQENTLLAGSLHENVTFGREIDIDRVYDALETAQLMDDVRVMPMALATPVGNEGLHLSGGQRQRLCIARAIVGDPAILILDEATSAIDRLTERRIYQGLAKLRCTKIIVTHRLYMARGADHVIVLDRGRVVESGRHAELLERDGLYATMTRRRRKRGSDHSARGSDSIGAV